MPETPGKILEGGYAMRSTAALASPTLAATSTTLVTGAFAGVAPSTEVDGGVIGEGSRGPVVERLQGLYQALLKTECGR